jgi:L-threonylcarbamoyladenylate synthase
MTTEPLVLRIDGADPSSSAPIVEEAAARLAEGKVVLLPAEGLYGYHVRADRPEGLERLRTLKPRGTEKGWILLLGDPRAFGRWDPALPSRAGELAERHWPGPLTIVVPASSSIPSALSAADGTVAVRCPGNPFLLAVVRASGGLLVSTSANRPGGPPPSRLEDAVGVGAALGVDAGPLSGLPSTLVKVSTGSIEILRRGALDLADVGGDQT